MRPHPGHAGRFYEHMHSIWMRRSNVKLRRIWPVIEAGRFGTAQVLTTLANGKMSLAGAQVRFV